MKLRAVLFITALLSGCAPVRPYVYTPPPQPVRPELPPVNQRPATKEEIALATHSIMAQVKDPDSVQVRALYVANVMPAGDRERILCGEFNAKNSYGGYVGFGPFVGYIRYSANGQIAAVNTAIDGTYTTATRNCLAHGIRIH